MGSRDNRTGNLGVAGQDPKDAAPKRNAVDPSKPRRPGRPRGAKGAVDPTLESLLDSAIDLFARYGYEAISTGDIAKAANFTQSIVHYHFGSKEQIWRAAVTRLMRQRAAAFAPARLKLSDLGPFEKLELLIRRLVEANAAQPNYARILMQESVAHTDRLSWLVEQFIAPGFRMFDEAISEAMDAGLIRSMPVHDVTNVITSAASLTFSLGPLVQQIYKVDVNSPAYISSLADSVVEIIFKGLGADKA
jgi:TetR/AcrR family transcriptional regulator